MKGDTMKAKKTLKKKVEQQIAVPKDTAPVTDNIDVLDAVQLQASVELGRTRLTLDEALNIGEQSLIELDKSVGDAVDVMLNGKLFARGEIVTVAENYGVRLTEVLGNDIMKMLHRYMPRSLLSLQQRYL